MDGSFPEDTLRQFGLDLARGLQYCHSRGVLHGDLRPANILLSDDGRLRISDFSLAWHASEEPQAQGAPYYMAPERFEATGAQQVAYTADLWSLGVCLYEMHAGAPPWRCESLEELARRIAHDPAPVLEGEPRHLMSLVSLLLRKQAATRATWHQIREHPFWGLEVPSLTPRAITCPCTSLICCAAVSSRRIGSQHSIFLPNSGYGPTQNRPKQGPPSPRPQ